MKIKNLLLFAAAASISASAFADDLATGELAWLINGDPAMVGQTTNDHIFARNGYNDMGEVKKYDNIISFKGGTPQLVWFFLDDDEVYETDWIQNLPKAAYNADGDLYNEITYSSFQFSLYVPQSVALVKTENEDGDEITFVGGPRLPLSNIVLSWGKQSFTKVVDGVTYDVYTVVQSNTGAYCTHFSSKNGNLYKKNGALKKDDGALLGLYFQNNNQAEVEGHLPDLIIANQEFGITECNTLDDVNKQRFIYGEGGNNETQRFQYYNRISLYGSTSVVENLGEKTISSVKYFNIAGMQSNEPFEGVNIKVTTYNDGTTTTCKVMK